MKAQLCLILLSFLCLPQLLNSQIQPKNYSLSVDPGNPDALFTGEYKGVNHGNLILTPLLQAGVSRHDSSYLWYFDASTDTYNLGERELYHYDANGRVDSILGEERVGEEWENSFLSTFSYNEFDLLEVNTLAYWINNQWRDSYRTTYTYDEDQRRIEEKVEFALTGPLVNFFLFLYEYNDQNLLIKQITREWKTIAWANSVYRENTYDDQNRIIHQLRQDWESGAWENYRDYTYTYDTLSNLKEYRGRVWSVSDWMVEFRNVYQYDSLNNRLLLQRQHPLSGNFWSFVNQELYSYDIHNNLITETEQVFTNNEWANTYMGRFGFDEDDQQISIVNLEWENSWVPQDSFYRFYNLFTSATHQPHIHQALLHPNPAKDIVTIPQDSIGQITSVVIYNSNGGVVREVNPGVFSSGSISVHDLPAGHYFVLIRQNAGHSIARFVKSE